nr:NUDIX domain-containing protein [Amnibacterium flavum]
MLVTDPDGRTLLVRKQGSGVFMQPGGKPEPGEAAAAAAVRELEEETGIVVAESDLVPLGEFRAEAANEPGHDVVADAFAIEVPAGAIEPRAEIADAVWVTRADAELLPLAPLTAVHLLPILTDRHPGSAARDE